MADAPAEAPATSTGEGELTDLGQLTLSRFRARFGDEAEKKFSEALEDGHISRHKMYRPARVRANDGKFAKAAG